MGYERVDCTRSKSFFCARPGVTLNAFLHSEDQWLESAPSSTRLNSKEVSQQMEIRPWKIAKIY